jgi:hypothetical protein
MHVLKHFLDQHPNRLLAKMVPQPTLLLGHKYIVAGFRLVPVVAKRTPGRLRLKTPSFSLRMFIRLSSLPPLSI